MNQKKTSFSTRIARQNRRQNRKQNLRLASCRFGQCVSRPGRKGFGTLEVVIIIAVLLSIALIFRASLTRYAENMIQAVLGDQSVIDDLADDNVTAN